MSEQHRKDLVEVAANIAIDAERLTEMSADERFYFWRDFDLLCRLVEDIEREYPQYNTDGSAA